MSVQPLTGSYVCRHMTDWIAIFDHVVSSFQITQCNLMTLRDIFKSGDRLLINRQLCLFWNRVNATTTLSRRFNFIVGCRVSSMDHRSFHFL